MDEVDYYAYNGLTHGIADRAFLEDYHSAYWHPGMAADIEHRLDFVNDRVGLWLAKWGGMNNWHGGLPHDQLRQHEDAGTELIFRLGCAMDGDVEAIPRNALRTTLLYSTQIMERLGRGLGLLECLLRTK